MCCFAELESGVISTASLLPQVFFLIFIIIILIIILIVIGTVVHCLPSESHSPATRCRQRLCD